MGILAHHNVKATEDAEVVVLLKEAGGILLAVIVMFVIDRIAPHIGDPCASQCECDGGC